MNPKELYDMDEHVESLDVKVLKRLVRESYAATSGEIENPAEAVMYRTSRELQYEFRESCEPSVAEVSQAMMAMGFQGVPKDGTFYWMLYER
ncbi:MAG: hypothetical protein IJT97_11320 [Bacteroidaceae bacterium]|nr:hypothetical protein [Bacteroidaceae bacterium]